MGVIDFLKKFILFFMGGTDPCKLLVEKVQSCLGEKRKTSKELIYNSRLAIAENDYRQNPLRLVGHIIEDNWSNRVFDLIDRCCEVIKANTSHLSSRRSDNGESSQNGVDDAISSLVHLAEVFFEFDELCNLANHLKTHFPERSESASINSVEVLDLLTCSADDDEKHQILREITNNYGHSEPEPMEDPRRRRNLRRGMVHMKMKFDNNRIIFQTLLLISEGISYGLNLTAENNIGILVPILVLSATFFLFINIPLTRRCYRERTVRVISPIEWVESSFSTFQLVADILKVAGHAESSSKVTETWVLVFAVIGYVFFFIKWNATVDGGRSNQEGTRNWVKPLPFGGEWSRLIGKIKRRRRVADESEV